MTIVQEAVIEVNLLVRKYYRSNNLTFQINLHPRPSTLFIYRQYQNLIISAQFYGQTIFSIHEM